MINIKTDSRKVKPGDTFIAIPNVIRDGHDYIEQAIKNGASRVIVEHGDYDVETIIVESTREYLKDYLYKNYYPLIKEMKLIGITGTNVKTKCCLYGNSWFLLWRCKKANDEYYPRCRCIIQHVIRG